jgi:nucleoside-diphosphate-sugar epimerase
MHMNVLVLGGSGYIGQRLISLLADSPEVHVTGASRKAPSRSSPAQGIPWLQLDTRDPAALSNALERFDAVVNCVAGDGRSIAEGAKRLTEAAQASGQPRLVHLSTMSVYGAAEGRINEEAALDPGLGWYGRAKCEAEEHMSTYARQGGGVVMFRPGCVYGPGSELWVGRVGRWLRAGRLGDVGVAGDGWSNLVHVDDVCMALQAALTLPLQPGTVPVYNLAAPDSPRWNSYFVDLALAIGATPVRRLGTRQLQFDAWLGGPPLKLAQRGLNYLRQSSRFLPDPMPPGLLRLWAQHLQLDGHKASRELSLHWTPYPQGLQGAAEEFVRSHAGQSPMRQAA